ncbi:unnamed protein product [Diatraea saccharalis]|uniref:RWD domain-containing protein n=1 Tax=Diatraea saccharalis TaxID=40085 RepID=A0A9N9R4P7_9NEOP|nr:unnamed protein product [Diatraea saccharalis]
MSEETTEERQDNELAALQAIYGEDVTDNRTSVQSKAWRPLDIQLKLYPHRNSEIKDVDCYIILNVKCCSSYPDKPPKISFKKIHGLSTDNGNKLLSELKALASQHCGEVMIFELSQHVQQFLHDHHKPILSCYEEMLIQKREMEQSKLHNIQSKTNEEVLKQVQSVSELRKVQNLN